MTLERGKFLFQKGDKGSALFIVKKGPVKIILPSQSGIEIMVTIFAQGDYFDEMALLDGEPRSADAVTIEPSEVLVLDRTGFLSFLQSNPEAIKALLILLSRRIRKTDELLEDSCFLNISATLTKKLD